jgi:hypothetical protein
MSSYFDPQADAMLLPEQYRGAKELVEVSAEAEADIINRFTNTSPGAYATAEPLGGNILYRYVHLDGFNDDASLAAAALVSAMKRSIAELVAWKLLQRRKDASISSESGKEGGVTYKPGADDTIPHRILRWLEPFDLRDPPLCV